MPTKAVDGDDDVDRDEKRAPTVVDAPPPHNKLIVLEPTTPGARVKFGSGR